VHNLFAGGSIGVSIGAGGTGETGLCGRDLGGEGVGDPVTSSALPSSDIDNLIFEPDLVLSRRPLHEFGCSFVALQMLVASPNLYISKLTWWESQSLVTASAM